MDAIARPPPSANGAAAADGAIEWDVVSPYHLEKSLLTVELVDRAKEGAKEGQ